MQIDLSDLTFLFHVRLDTEERIKNIQTVVNFYRKHCINFKMIFIEDDKQERLSKYITFLKDDTHKFFKNDEIWNKCRSFNRGIALTKTKYIAFHDLDAILHPSQFSEAIKELQKNSTYGLVYPYSGIFFCISQDFKRKFSETLVLH